MKTKLTPYQKKKLYKIISFDKCQYYADVICRRFKIPVIEIIHPKQKKIKSYKGEYILPNKIISYISRHNLEFIVHELSHHLQYHRRKNKIYGYVTEKIYFDENIIIMNDRQHGANFRQCYTEILKVALGLWNTGK